ncbi:MAG TPA: hypothetical protein VGB68_02285 [Pyrinomonadaceae bacterium]
MPSLRFMTPAGRYFELSFSSARKFFKAEKATPGLAFGFGR